MIPHFAFPFQLQGSSFAVVDQDTSDEIIQCVEVLLGTRTGQRVELPGYGIDDPLFTDQLDAQGILNAISDWEPRAVVTLDGEIDDTDELVEHIRVQVAGGDEA